MSIWTQKSALIQPRTSPPKFALFDLILVLFGPYPAQPAALLEGCFCLQRLRFEESFWSFSSHMCFLFFRNFALEFFSSHLSVGVHLKVFLFPCFFSFETQSWMHTSAWLAAQVAAQVAAQLAARLRNRNAGPHWIRGRAF